MLPRLIAVMVRIILLMIVCFAGYSYVTNWLNERLEQRVGLKEDRQTFSAKIQIDSIIAVDERGAKHFKGLLISPLPESGKPRRLKISWYPPYKPEERPQWQAEADKLEIGHILQTTITQRAFRNFYNPGGFDYEAHMLSRQLDGRAYLRQVEIIGQVEHSWSEQLKYQLARYRQSNIDSYLIDSYLNENDRDPNALFLIPALVYGDSSLIPPLLMNQLQALGGIHLVVVSGLHMGLMLMFAWFGLRFFQRCCVYLVDHYRNQGNRINYLPSILLIGFSKLAPIFLLLVLAGYLLISGMGISAQRAWIMIAAVLLLSVFQIRPKPLQGFFAALIIVFIANPISIVQLGFSFSFSCVAILLMAFMGRKSWLQAWWRPQIIVFLMSGILLSLFAMPFSLSQLLFNFIAVPVMAFFLLPMALVLSMVELNWLTLVFSSIFQWLMDWGFWLMAIDFLDISIALVLTEYEWWQFLVLAICLVMFWLPKVFIGQWLALIIFIATFISSFFQSEFKSDLKTQLVMWDVGQGLSVWVGGLGDKRRPWNLLYDTGNAFSPRFNLGSAVVAPALRSMGVRSLQQVVVSHDDNDHAAGLSGIQQWFDIEQLHVGQTISNMEVQGAAESNCHSITSDWQQVSQFLSWRYLHYLDYLKQNYDPDRLSDNDHSCVIQLRYQPSLRHDLASDINEEIIILITGDIEKRAEQALVELYAEDLQSDVLISPHHGSKSSSSLAFLKQVRPKTVLVSAGFNNRFRHPHPTVTDRYDELGIRWLNTADHGALIMDLEQLVNDKYAGRFLTIESGYDLQSTMWRQKSLTEK